jgi:hypothetical protein
MFVRAYLRASTDEQDANRARGELKGHLAVFPSRAGMSRTRAAPRWLGRSCSGCWLMRSQATCCWSSRWTGYRV